MAKKAMIERDVKRKRLVKQNSSRRARLKAIARDKSIAAEDRFKAQLQLAELPRNSSPNRMRNRCQLTGRPRGFYRKLKLSRVALRELTNQGLIPGMVKSSW